MDSKITAERNLSVAEPEVVWMNNFPLVMAETFMIYKDRQKGQGTIKTHASVVLNEPQVAGNRAYLAYKNIYLILMIR